jgi:hypothetical protein
MPKRMCSGTHTPALSNGLFSTGAVMNTKQMLPAAATMFLAAAAFTGCQLAPMNTSLSEDNQQQIRAAAHEFTDAMRAGDADRLRGVSTVDTENQKLGKAVINDTVTSRKMLESLSSHFGYVEEKPFVVASNGFINRLATTASAAPIRRAGDRALISAENGEIYLRNIAGAWKVELIPTMVPESGGKSTINDPVVEYRFGVAHELNQWMLARLENNEFQSKTDFDRARSKFWMQYLTYAANGKDPQDTLLPSLPAMPKDSGTIAQER